MDDLKTVLGDRLAHDGEIEVPFVKHRLGLGLLFGAQHHQHAFLGFRQHHLVGRHMLFATGDVVEVQPNAQAALVAHLNRRAGQTRRAHVLDGDDGTGLHQFQRRFHQALFGEGIAHLHGRALFLDRFVEFG